MEGCPDLCYYTSHLPRGRNPHPYFCDLALTLCMLVFGRAQGSSQCGLLSLQQSMSKFTPPSVRQD